jgi:hypothetical protein
MKLRRLGQGCSQQKHERRSYDFKTNSQKGKSSGALDHLGPYQAPGPDMNRIVHSMLILCSGTYFLHCLNGNASCHVGPSLKHKIQGQMARQYAFIFPSLSLTP